MKSACRILFISNILRIQFVFGVYGCVTQNVLCFGLLIFVGRSKSEEMFAFASPVTLRVFLLAHRNGVCGVIFFLSYSRGKEKNFYKQYI